MQQLLDFPEHVERTEPNRQRQLEALAFDVDDSGLEWTVRDVIEELELLVDGKAVMDHEDFIDGVKEQAKRLLK
ncbi:hypothetical protein [Brevibacillus brevis]|uniref:hypothetical protein n=1 Tax=Brevibacillus brevis TaxID=1393 RepID=UPI000D0FEEB2|nr:hypothetical protein [Brevibacillus brevis]PSJ66325.1 hypothetical protein C7J99_26680 [Brevibacillus brevis]RED21840.1 hypothetical protein DES34_118105 [Brevibacillus brevis]GEC93081.1 hypothetical protein BBR01nite_54120 [Brevibacillus brevis]VEF92703.1 Uncharacterised protein [Brevibacillus brevis]